MEKRLSHEVICIAEIKAKSGMVEALLTELAKLIPLSKQESGCVRYEIHQSVEDENLITFVDRFKDMKAFNFHCETNYIKKYFDDIIPKLADDIKISLYKEITFEENK